MIMYDQAKDEVALLDNITSKSYSMCRVANYRASMAAPQPSAVQRRTVAD